MLNQIKLNFTEFDWDKGNKDKSYEKHGITVQEAEEIFLDENLGVIPDIKHSAQEQRLIALGKTFNNKLLLVIFTLRKNKIRAISARIMNKKERKQYENT